VLPPHKLLRLRLDGADLQRRVAARERLKVDEIRPP
jgi:hypothetical protein